MKSREEIKRLYEAFQVASLGSSSDSDASNGYLMFAGLLGWVLDDRSGPGYEAIDKLAKKTLSTVDQINSDIRERVHDN